MVYNALHTMMPVLFNAEYCTMCPHCILYNVSTLYAVHWVCFVFWTPTALPDWLIAKHSYKIWDILQYKWKGPFYSRAWCGALERLSEWQGTCLAWMAGTSVFTIELNHFLKIYFKPFLDFNIKFTNFLNTNFWLPVTNIYIELYKNTINVVPFTV